MPSDPIHRAFLAYVILSLLIPAVELQRANGAEDDADKAAFYLSAMLAGRERIVSGEYVMSGWKTMRSSLALPLTESPLASWCVFDFGSDKLRFESTTPWSVEAAVAQSGAQFPNGEHIQSVPNDDPDFATRRIRNVRVKYARNGPRCAIWNDFDFHSAGDALAINLTDATFPLNYLFHYVDVRSVGLFDARAHRGATTLQSALSFFETLRGEIADVEEVGGRVLLRWKRQGGSTTYRTSLTLDSAYEFAPVRFEYAAEDSPGSGTFAAPTDFCDVTYETRAGVAVPRTAHLYSGGQVEGGTVLEEYHWDFQWKQVNEPVDEARFSYLDFDLPAGLTVNSSRVDPATGQMIVETLPPFPGRPRSWVSRWPWFVAAAAAVLLALTGWLLRRARRRPRSDSPANDQA